MKTTFVTYLLLFPNFFTYLFFHKFLNYAFVKRKVYIELAITDQVAQIDIQRARVHICSKSLACAPLPPAAKNLEIDIREGAQIKSGPISGREKKAFFFIASKVSASCEQTASTGRTKFIWDDEVMNDVNTHLVYVGTSGLRVRCVVVDDVYAAVDLTLCTSATLDVSAPDGTTTSLVATIETTTGGILYADLSATILATAGTYVLQPVITFSDGDIILCQPQPLVVSAKYALE